MENATTVNVYIQTQEGKWVLSPEAKAASAAMYYDQRVAYDPQDQRHIIGRYTASGEVSRYSLFPAKTGE